MKPLDKIKTMKTSEYARYLEEGITYNQYRQQMAQDQVSNPDEKIRSYIDLNLHRMQRIDKTFSISAKLREEVKKMLYKTWWLVITEHWCGDASQTLPVLNKIAELSGGKIEMKIVYRDEHPELMDAYLTEGTRSIPKLIQLDGQMNVTGIWGPRPTVAKQLVKRLRSSPETASNYSKELHFWYANDKQHSLETEISKMLVKANLFCPDYLS